jgi:hypothetical protein
MNMGFAWYPTNDADRPEGGRSHSDRDYYRTLGVDVDARPKKHRLKRGTAKLNAAVPASFSVFRALMRRPAGATIVVLVPRAARPSAPDGVTVIDERELSDAS